MRFVLVLLAAAAFAAPAAASLETVVLSPADDVSLPFLCSWGYDWQERCYRDDLDRLELGGAGDKVWRSALRFSLDGALPPGATVVTAELWLRYDGTCTAPLRSTDLCDGRGFSLEARPIFTSDWYARREVAFGPAVAWAEVEPGAVPKWVVLDVTDTVADWNAGLATDGVLLKLVDEQEDYAVGGPAMPSSSYADAAVRPRLVVWVMS
jgi:hypothetical protein